MIADHNSTDPRFGYNLSEGQPNKSVSVQTRKAREARITEQSNAKPVICVETGEVFPSASAAASHIKVDRSSFRKQMKQGQRCHGYHWRQATQEEVLNSAG